MLITGGSGPLEPFVWQNSFILQWPYSCLNTARLRYLSSSSRQYVQSIIRYWWKYHFYRLFIQDSYWLNLSQSACIDGNSIKAVMWQGSFCTWFEPLHDKTNKMACAPSEDSDQLGHSHILIRVFTVCSKKASVLSYPLRAQRRLWSDWADAQAGPSLRWAHSHFVGFVMKWLILSLSSVVFFQKFSLTQRNLTSEMPVLFACLRTSQHY